MRILVVNPNTTESMTEKIGRSAVSVASAQTEILAVNPAQGPVSIEGFYDEAFAVPGIIDEIVKNDGDKCDGYVLACFDDTGVEAARCITDKPVVGICEAAVYMASIVATRFAIVTTLPRSVAAIESLVMRYGVDRRCRVRDCDVPVLDLEDPASNAGRRLSEEIARAIEEDRAEAVILGCAGMSDLARALTEEFERPVIDGVTAAVKLIEGAVGMELLTSKAGAYASPRRKEYRGALSEYGPRG